jgi:hypothetical protein
MIVILMVVGIKFREGQTPDIPVKAPMSEDDRAFSETIRVLSLEAPDIVLPIKNWRTYWREF